MFLPPTVKSTGDDPRLLLGVMHLIYLTLLVQIAFFESEDVGVNVADAGHAVSVMRHFGLTEERITLAYADR